MLSPLVDHRLFLGAGESSELADPVVVRETQPGLHLQLAAAKLVLPDVVVPHLHHVLRLHHELAAVPVPATAVTVSPVTAFLWFTCVFSSVLWFCTE